jgi:hypothetical protein
MGQAEGCVPSRYTRGLLHGKTCNLISRNAITVLAAEKWGEKWPAYNLRAQRQTFHSGTQIPPIVGSLYPLKDPEPQGFAFQPPPIVTPLEGNLTTVSNRVGQ